VAAHADLIEFYRSYGESSFEVDEPAYAEVCHHLGDYPGLVELIAAHDPDAQQPNLLFAAVHYLILGGAEHPLADVYAGRSNAAPAPLFADFVQSHRNEVNELLRTQRTQTNEVGRSAVLALMLQDAQRRTGLPLAWIDLGASGGLNLNVDQFRIEYRHDGQVTSTGPGDATVSLECNVRSGQPPLDDKHADIAWRVGVDRAPIDVTDDQRARWLKACLWPSKQERHERIDAAIEVARSHRPVLIEADAVAGVEAAIGHAPTDVALVMTTTWVWYYLPPETRAGVVSVLRQSERPVLWYSLEGRGVVEPLGESAGRDVIDSMIGVVVYDGAASTDAEVLGMAHPHGAWLDWY